MELSVVIATHVGPLTTQIKEHDTVASFLKELKETVALRLSPANAINWHFLIHKAQILPPSGRLLDFVRAPNETLVYVHPVDAASPSPPQKKALVPSLPSPTEARSSTPVPINVSSSRAQRRSSVSILPATMPPPSYFDAENLRGLESLGFSELRAMQALLMYEKFDLALDWLLGLEDLEEGAPLPKADQAMLDEALAKYIGANP